MNRSSLKFSNSYCCICSLYLASNVIYFKVLFFIFVFRTLHCAVVHFPPELVQFCLRFRGPSCSTLRLVTFIPASTARAVLSCTRGNKMKALIILSHIDSGSVSPGGRFSPWWSSTSLVTRWWRVQAILWWPSASTRSPNGPTSSPRPPQPRSSHSAPHHAPTSPAPAHAHPAHAEPRSVRM